MTTKLWEVRYKYSLSHNGLETEAIVCIAAGNITEAAEIAVAFLNQIVKYDKRIVSVKETDYLFFQKLS